VRKLFLLFLLVFTAIRVFACDGDISPSDTICFEPGGTYPVIFTGSAGTAPYTFVYSINGGAPQTIISSGNSAILDVPMTVIGNTQYTLISVTDASGCTVTINESNDILTVINPGAMIGGTTTVYQNSTPFPEFTFTGSGGVTPYTFFYTINGGPVQTITTAPGSSSVTLPISTAVVGVFTLELLNIQSPVACPNILPPIITNPTATITVIPVPMIVSGSNQTVCKGASSANATFTATGSSGPYTYTYVVGGVTQTITGGSPITIPSPTGTAGVTTYTLTGITDVYGNYQAVSAVSTVTVLPTPSGSISVSRFCSYYTLNFNASGGSGPFVYTYTVNGVTNTVTGGSSVTVNGTPVSFPTTFTVSGVTVTNAAGCTGQLSSPPTFQVSPNFTHSINASATSVCVNSPSPVVTFSAFGSPSSYPTFYYTLNSGPVQMISNGSFSSTLNVPTTTAGTYTYLLSGTGHMCDAGFPVSVSVVVKPLPTATISGTASVCRNGVNPVVTFTGANGTAPYIFTYKINGGANQTISSGAGSAATINAPTTATGTFTYSLVSVSSAAGCSQNQTGNAVITVNPLPTATISGTTTICQNGTSPVITFTGAGASAPYTFSYNINGGASQTISSGSASTVTLPVSTSNSGTFTYNLLSVSSSAGCSQIQTGSAVVTINSLPTASILGSTSLSLCQNDVSPTITFTGSNGTSPYSFTYNINGGPNQTISSGAGSTAAINAPTTTTGTFTYSLVSVSSAAGCSQNQTGVTVITVNPLPTATISGTTTVCQNGTSPVITFTGAGASAPYTFSYNINGGATQTISSGSASTVTLPVSTSNSGTFTYNLLSVSSSAGCSQIQTGSAVVTINSGSTASISGNTTICEGGTASFTISGSPSATVTYTDGTNVFSLWLPVSGSLTISTPILFNTTTYTLTSSQVMCTMALNESIQITVTPAPVMDPVSDITSCPGQLIQVPSFAPSGISFSWTNSNTSIGLAASGNGDIADFNAVNTQLLAQTSIITVTPLLNGCTGTPVSFSIQVSEPPLATISGITAVCQNATDPVVTFTGSNGTAPYTFSYTINGGAAQTISSGSGSTATINVPTSNSGVFTYQLLAVSDAGSCSQNQTGSAAITVNPTPTATIAGATSVCQNNPAQITFEGFGGTIPYTFSYSVNGGGIQTISSGSGSTAQVSVLTTSPSNFLYELNEIEDALGCSQTTTSSVGIVVNEVPAMSGIPPVCQGATVQLSAGGSSPVISWTSSDPGVASISNTSLLTSIAPGSATITCTNSDGCSDSQTIQVQAGPTASIIGNTTVCEGNTAVFTISGSPGSTVTYTDGTTITNLWMPASGSIAVSTPVLFTTTTYTLTSAQTLCSQTLNESIQITVNPLPVMDPISDITICPEQLVHVPSFTPNGISFSWTNSNTSIGLGAAGNGDIADFNSVNAQASSQSGTVTVTPSLNGCTGIPVSFTIQVSEFPTADAGADQSFCANSTLAHFIGSTATAGNSYSWSPTAGLSDPTISNPSVTSALTGQNTYVLTVTSSLGCQHIDTVLITGIAAPQVSLNASSLSACQNGIINFHLDTLEQVTTEWFVDGIMVPEHSNEVDWSSSFGSGIHTVEVIAANSSGCSSIVSISGGITIYTQVNADFTADLNSTTIDAFTDHINLINQSENASVYEWLFNGDLFSSETHTTLNFEPGIDLITIQLIARNEYGCLDTATLQLQPLGSDLIFVPNTFTPDGNQWNELFIPVISDDFDKSNYLFEIYNRWGERIFSTTDPSEGWNGHYKGLPSKTDTYTWKLTLKSLKTDFAESIVGHVNLLR
jgi:gliding motility-associated-like protein